MGRKRKRTDDSEEEEEEEEEQLSGQSDDHGDDARQSKTDIAAAAAAAEKAANKQKAQEKKEQAKKKAKEKRANAKQAKKQASETKENDSDEEGQQGQDARRRKRRKGEEPVDPALVHHAYDIFVTSSEQAEMLNPAIVGDSASLAVQQSAANGGEGERKSEDNNEWRAEPLNTGRQEVLGGLGIQMGQQFLCPEKKRPQAQSAAVEPSDKGSFQPSVTQVNSETVRLVSSSSCLAINKAGEEAKRLMLTVTHCLTVITRGAVSKEDMTRLNAVVWSSFKVLAAERFPNLRVDARSQVTLLAYARSMRRQARTRINTAIRKLVEEKRSILTAEAKLPRTVEEARNDEVWVKEFKKTGQDVFTTYINEGTKKVGVRLSKEASVRLDVYVLCAAWTFLHGKLGKKQEISEELQERLHSLEKTTTFPIHKELTEHLLVPAAVEVLKSLKWDAFTGEKAISPDIDSPDSDSEYAAILNGI